MALQCGLCGERVAPGDGREPPQFGGKHLMEHNPGAVHLTGTEVAEFFDDEDDEGGEAHG